MTIKTYDPSAIAVVVGKRTLENLADTFVSVDFNEDAYTYTPNVDGGGTRNYNPNRSGRITVTLKQSSDDNLYLSGIHAADLISKLGTVPVTVKDTNGNSLHFAASAWIIRSAPSEYAKEVGDREWVFETDELISVPAGSF